MRKTKHVCISWNVICKIFIYAPKVNFRSIHIIKYKIITNYVVGNTQFTSSVLRLSIKTKIPMTFRKWSALLWNVRKIRLNIFAGITIRLSSHSKCFYITVHLSPTSFSIFSFKKCASLHFLTLNFQKKTLKRIIPWNNSLILIWSIYRFFKNRCTYSSSFIFRKFSSFLPVWNAFAQTN